MEAYLGQIALFAFDFPPRGWAACDGQILQIAQNQALFSLLGTTFGGNGSTTFGLPDLRGRVVAHAGAQGGQGQASGVAAVTLAGSQMPADAHPIFAVSDAGDVNTPVGNYLAAPASVNCYGDASATPGTLAPDGVAMAGGNQPHENQQPYQAVNFCIALTGIYPSRN